MEYHVEETTIEALTRMLIETPSPVSYYEEIHPLMERLAKSMDIHLRMTASAPLISGWRERIRQKRFVSVLTWIPSA